MVLFFPVFAHLSHRQIAANARSAVSSDAEFRPFFIIAITINNALSED